MKKSLILFGLILMMCSFVLAGCFGGDDIDVSGDEVEYLEAEYLEDSEVIDDRDLAADLYDEEGDSSSGMGVVVTGDECEALEGTWVMNTYATNITSAAGAISNIHNNSGKIMTLGAECTYTEDYATEQFVPARLVQTYEDRGMDISQITALIGVPAEDIQCSYEGQNIGEFTIDPTGNGYNVVAFEQEEGNQISGSCSPNVAGAVKISGTHYTPGVATTAVKQYEYLLNGDKLTLRAAFIPQTGTEVEMVITYTK